MLAFRSHLFNVLFYVNLAIWLLAATITLVMPRRAIIRVAQAWGRFNLVLLRVIVGTRVEFRGRDRIPPGPLLIASKHQSFLETFTILFCVDDPAFILKRELEFIPFFGWLARKARMIPVRRGGTTAFAEMNRRAQWEITQGRDIIIFPEGTRRPPGAEPAYKNGVAHLYRALGVTCLPVALNSGLFWPRRHFIRRPGTVVIAFLEPIEPGLDRDDFLDRLRDRIETASDALRREATPSGETPSSLSTAGAASSD